MNRAPQSVPIARDQILAAGQVLARAFLNDPLCVYTQPDREARVNQFTWLFAQLAQEGAARGSVYANTCTDRPDGVAVWVPPQAGEPKAEVLGWSEMDQMVQRFEPEPYRRFTEAFRHFEHVHHRCSAGPHWYLALLGVSPECQRQGIGGKLLAPVLQLADREGLLCYLETFVSDKILFYQHRGFQVVETGVEPQSKIAFWAMKRVPHARQRRRYAAQVVTMSQEPVGGEFVSV